MTGLSPKFSPLIFIDKYNVYKCDETLPRINNGGIAKVF